MNSSLHLFHIPVMGTGFTIDSPIRVAHLGIHSAISVVDDLLLERIRRHYSGQYGFPFSSIPRNAPDGRARRISAYLDLVLEIVTQRFNQLKELSFGEKSAKSRYFRLLPDISPLKQEFLRFQKMPEGPGRQKLAKRLTDRMKPGEIEVNIMAKVDALRATGGKIPAESEMSDASSALRGFANSSLDSSLVLSAGFNPSLYGYLTRFREFYRNAEGRIRKKIILKVSDFRSALIQGRYLAKKGLEIAEYRIESGLNCGGHAFATEGLLLPVVLKEFHEKREELAHAFRPLIRGFYRTAGWEYPDLPEDEIMPAITVQGGVGNRGECLRLMKEYGMDRTGWGSPFLLVPEATCVDEETSRLLEKAREEDLYLSGVSPLGIPFNHIRHTGSEHYREERIRRGKPGSPCPKGFLVSNTEFTEEPICTASTQYQLLKIRQIEESARSQEEKDAEKEKVLEKSCLCTDLGAGALIRLGIVKPSYGRQAICPGPNIAWFDRRYTLEEMTDHIYGRGPSLVPSDRPHMFAKEMTMYVDYLEERIRQSGGDETEKRRMHSFCLNLGAGIHECLTIARSSPYEGENLTSLESAALEQMERLKRLSEVLESGEIQAESPGRITH